MQHLEQSLIRARRLPPRPTIQASHDGHYALHGCAALGAYDFQHPVVYMPRIYRPEGAAGAFTCAQRTKVWDLGRFPQLSVAASTVNGAYAACSRPAGGGRPGTLPVGSSGQ
ncbi:hypothetical protein CDD83_4852 [Cordyceps sp. RAO-2017]|nr:hypothetical protein CDD83_4852 [Cordyceps sp. RAO-2017]